MPRWSLVSAVIRRDVVAYFSNPIGYVFITVFVGLSALSAFWPDEFFASNLATLDTLTDKLPVLLLFFVPAITMGVWADERRQGTEELLLTLPATELELVLGKYGASLSTYAIALLFSLMHVLVLTLVGDPDWGLLIATYFGYFLLGASLLSMGMIGSLFAGSPTVAFIYGAILCGSAVFFARFGELVTDPGTPMNRFFVEGSVLFPFREAANGVVTLQTLFTAVTTIAAMILLAVVVLAARRRGRLSPHGPVRFAAVALLGLSVSILASRAAFRVDLTAERLNTLSATTDEVLAKLDPERPVYLRAYVSSNVPHDYVGVRKKLLQTLREYDARAGGSIVLEVRPTEPYSEAAREAEEQYGIQAQDVQAERGGSATFDRIYLGVAATCGAQRVVLPFMHRRFSAEYEITRALRVVSQEKRKRLGLLVTDAKVTGGFDFNSMRQNPEWMIVTELRQQYEVVDVPPDAEYPADLDVLLAIAPSSLAQAPLDRFQRYVLSGKPVVLVEDPLPRVNPALSPNEAKGSDRNPFMQGQPPPEQKGDFAAVARAMGVRLQSREVVWDQWNPLPRYGTIPREIVFIGEGNGAKHPFGEQVPITDGLQLVVALWGGHVERASDRVTLTPLLVTGAGAGTHPYDRLVRKSFFGFQGVNQLPTTTPTGRAYVLAALVSGDLAPPENGGEKKSVNACVLADLDMVSDAFFQFRQSGPEDFRFDNVEFILNCIDWLAGDHSFIQLRTRRPQHRPLQHIADRTKRFEDQHDTQVRASEEKKDTRLAEEQARLNQAVEAIRARKDLDEQQKRIQERQEQEAAQRRYDVAKVQIEGDYERDRYLARIDLEEQRRGIQNFTRLWALILPPVPALLLGLFILGARWSREREATR